MAKQIKGRKFFAATASAALVASAIVPVASAAEIKDADQIPAWAKEAVQALVEGKVIEGDQNGYFNPGGTVTRAVAAQILTKALDLPTTGTENFSDVKEGAWYYDAVVATSNAGIFKGNDLGQFDPNGLLTREQAASVIVRAFGLEGSADLSKFADADKVAGWAKEDMAIAVANGVIKGNGTSLNPKASITRAEIAVMVQRTIEEVSPDPVETELKVESVSAINAQEIQIKFNAKLNEASAEKISNYEIFKNGATTKLAGSEYTAELVDDNTVILQLVTPLVNNETYRVNAEGILTEEYKEVPKYEGETTIFVDKVAPTLVETTVKGNQLKLNFDEPVTISNIKVDGNSVAAGPVYPTDAGDYEVSYTLTNDQAKEGSHNVVLYGVEDAAGNETSLINTSYNVTADNSKPSVESITSVGTKTFDVKLNTEVASLGDSNVVIKKGNYTFPSSTYTVTKLTDPKKPNTYRVEFNSGVVEPSASNPNPVYADGESSVSLSVEVKDFKGTNNIFGTNYSGTVVLNKDTSAPVVQSEAINFVDGNNLVVLFNEEIVRGSGNVTVIKDGVQQTISGGQSGVTVDSTDKKRLLINLGSAPNGTYEVVLAKGAVTDIDGNKNDAVTTKVNAEATKGTLTIATTDIAVNRVNGKNVVTIDYGTEMTDSARNLANYKIDGVPLNDAFYAGAVAVFTDGTKEKVEITLPAGKHPVEDETKAIEFSKDIETKDNRIVQTADKKVLSLSKNFKDDKAPVLIKAEYVKASSSATSSNVIKLTFDENVKIDGNIADDIEVKVGNATVAGTLTDGAYTDAAENKELLYVLSDEVNTSQAGTVTIVEEGRNNATIGILDLQNNKAEAIQIDFSDAIVDSGITNAIAAAADLADVATAKSAVSTSFTADDPVAVTNLIDEIQDAVDAVVSGVVVSIESGDSLNAQVAESGEITYPVAPNLDVTGDVKVTLTKGSAVDYVTISVTVKAQ